MVECCRTSKVLKARANWRARRANRNFGKTVTDVSSLLVVVGHRKGQPANKGGVNLSVCCLDKTRLELYEAAPSVVYGVGNRSVPKPHSPPGQQWLADSNAWLALPRRPSRRQGGDLHINAIAHYWVGGTKSITINVTLPHMVSQRRCFIHASLMLMGVQYLYTSTSILA